jgi:hypothetical protein
MITFLISFSLGFVAGIYREAIAEKSRELYIKISEKK